MRQAVQLGIPPIEAGVIEGNGLPLAGRAIFHPVTELHCLIGAGRDDSIFGTAVAGLLHTGDLIAAIGIHLGIVIDIRHCCHIGLV